MGSWRQGRIKWLKATVICDRIGRGIKNPLSAGSGHVCGSVTAALAREGEPRCKGSSTMSYLRKAAQLPQLGTVPELSFQCNYERHENRIQTSSTDHFKVLTRAKQQNILPQYVPALLCPWMAVVMGTMCVPFCVTVFIGSWCWPRGVCCTIVTVCRGVVWDVWMIRLAAPIVAWLIAGIGSTLTEKQKIKHCVKSNGSLTL